MKGLRKLVKSRLHLRGCYQRADIKTCANCHYLYVVSHNNALLSVHVTVGVPPRLSLSYPLGLKAPNRSDELLPLLIGIP